MEIWADKTKVDIPSPIVLTSTTRCRNRSKLAALQFCLDAIMRYTLLCWINIYVTPLSYATGS